jgi:pimeloyl-ACP methyl ester carboxylesterase
MSARPNVVLVHGAWADGSCWASVVESLQAEGFTVTAPQFPETSLADDVARLRHVLKRQDGPTVVVGHSYGGQIVTALGPDAPNVVGLVYIAAFGLDEGESIGALLTRARPRRRWPTWRSTSWASPGCPRTTSCSTSPPTSTRRRPGHARRPAAAGRIDPAGRDGPAGLEVVPVLVPGGDRRRGHPAGRRAAVRRADGATTVEVASSHVPMSPTPTRW